MAIEWRRPGTGRHDSRPGLRANTRRSGPACYRNQEKLASGWLADKNCRELLLTQNRKHYLAVRPLGRVHLQPHLLAYSAAEESSYAVRLPAGDLHQFGDCCACGPAK